MTQSFLAHTTRSV